MSDFTEFIPRTVEELEPYWDFLYQGLVEISDPDRANLVISKEELFKVCVNCVSEGKVGRIIFLKQQDNLIGYGIYFENTPWWQSQRVGLIYAVYVPGNSPSACGYMLQRCIESALEDGIKVVETWARRFNEAAFRYYEKRYRFKMTAFVFRREI